MKGWIHRIDAVPRIGAMIEFTNDKIAISRGLIIPAARGEPYNGCADDVRIKIVGGEILQPSKTYLWWRYAD